VVVSKALAYGTAAVVGGGRTLANLANELHEALRAADGGVTSALQDALGARVWPH
jgi:hypothetical protein